MVPQQRIFFDFLKFCIGSVSEIPATLKDADWKVLYAIAKKQSLIGVLFHGIQRLPKELAPEHKLLMQWFAMAEMIRKQNIKLFQNSVRVCENFKKEGFANCILKGQGNALLYPEPYMRTPGDIDIYLVGGRKKIMKYVNKVCPNQVMRYHHVDFPVMKTTIEVHFTPSYMFFPLHNRRMQKWFKKVMDLQCTNFVMLPDGYGEISVPTLRFNLVYILSHLYRHVFTEGIGLRQLIDYYYVLTQEDSQYNREVAARNIGNFGMKRFASAVMYIMVDFFGMDSRYLLVEPNESEGKFLLEEVLIGGNFGQYDNRLGDKNYETVGQRWLRMSLRNVRFVGHYPLEALCEPLFRTGFSIWKKLR